ncbi:tryptophan--tRNA ligase [Desulfofundulus thermobenzoicus]|uniref:Tryptophan--tRNA ligase n=1 Tax=Desulfofundulus thermobenzoicus TaxID=29376 RepID=A0A6N7ISD4_9FIRM|nr:tryptophan--tRNA ligase [Desulfofundulus thermobenzoicus]MQL52984.1 tryptophan--tRNA ligase [Desulfofundulus thermobenzoicus]
MTVKRILSGMRPTGRLHIGHLSVLENWVELQKDHQCFFFVAYWHALTTAFDRTAGIKENTREMVTDWLAVGLDPEKSVIFVQADVPETAELNLLFSMITPLGWLYRVPTYKDQVRQFKEQGRDIMTHGFLGYPVLMAADILLYRADGVPVGEDQLPHLELCRELARRFNHLYRPVFPEPRAELSRITVLPGVDGRKMSKSYANDIGIIAETEEIGQRVNAMITDPARIRKTDPGHPEVCLVHTYHDIYTRDRLAEIEEDCRAGRVGCVACKKLLAGSLERVLGPLRERRRQIAARPGYVEEVLAEGARRARAEAAKTMELVREAMGI